MTEQANAAIGLGQNAARPGNRRVREGASKADLSRTKFAAVRQNHPTVVSHESRVIGLVSQKIEPTKGLVGLSSFEGPPGTANLLRLTRSKTSGERDENQEQDQPPHAGILRR